MADGRPTEVPSGSCVVVGWWPPSRDGGGIEVWVDGQLRGRRWGGRRRPIAFPLSSDGNEVRISYVSLGAGRKYSHPNFWEAPVRLEAGEGALILVRCAVRWIPFGRITPPTVTLKTGRGLAIPRPGRLRCGFNSEL